MGDYKRTETVIFDLDGTLANCDHRRHLVERSHPAYPGRQNWRLFNAKMFEDTPVMPLIRLCNMHYSLGYIVRIFTGREATAENKTMTSQWLDRFGVRHTSLWMRPEKDYRPDNEVKLDMLARSKKEGDVILYAVDDRQQVVDMWREQGIICLQCAPGDF